MPLPNHSTNMLLLHLTGDQIKSPDFELASTVKGSCNSLDLDASSSYVLGAFNSAKAVEFLEKQPGNDTAAVRAVIKALSKPFSVCLAVSP